MYVCVFMCVCVCLCVCVCVGGGGVLVWVCVVCVFVLPGQMEFSAQSDSFMNLLLFLGLAGSAVAGLYCSLSGIVRHSRSPFW